MIECIKHFWGEKPDGSDEQGKIINNIHVARLTKLIDTAGGKLMYGGKVNEGKKHIQPTIILNPNQDSQLMLDEIFGPILPIFTYKSMNEVIDFINNKPKPLAVYYFGKPHHKDSTDLRYKTSSGCFMTNECLMQCISHYQAFGGVGESGQGRYGGYEGFK
jgi:aldehyde dehydrogenase (NAD+)